MLRSLEPSHVAGLLDLWSRRWGDRFPLDLALWEQNTTGDPRHFRAARCWVIEEDHVIRGCLALKIPDDPPAWPGQEPRHGWISFLLVEPGRDQDVAPVLLQQAVEWLRGHGFVRLHYGGDPSHFFPGAPDDDAALRDALAAARLSPRGLAHDLLGEIRDHATPGDLQSRLRLVDGTVAACRPDDVPGLLRFVDAEFPGRWAYDTRRRLDIEPTPADLIVMKQGADVVGFCHIYHRGSRVIGPSIYWRQAVGNRYGGLGPIGVHRALRGRGLGSGLLAFALERLRSLGVEQMVIDWTTLVDYYGRFGFRIWRTYRSWHRDL